ncbi:hypothetical protein [Cellulomonas persica]|uniref:Uncharacterized protein n=1 Tax=Cellulomonas persica TaxID=76861 RepID=A0A510UQF1_9CELL|nr:hypothetical protein CPE01_06250 [Cellulomonas persica]
MTPDEHSAPEAVSAQMRRAKVQAFTDHTTVGVVETDPDGRVTIACACGMRLTNGPTWSLDEHIRLHRAEARFLALAAVAPSGIPRLVPWPLAAPAGDGAAPAASAHVE